MSTVVVVLGIVAVVVVVGWFFLNRQNPENAAGHPSPNPETASEHPYEEVDRPGGPGAEAMDPDLFGGDHRPPE